MNPPSTQMIKNRSTKNTSQAFRYSLDHLTEDHYQSFFTARETLCWEDAIAELMSRKDIVKPHKISTFLGDRRRNDFIFLLPITSESTVLDFGTGWGNTSLTLAQYCRRVVAMEADRNRLRFANQHFQHRGQTNISPVCAGKGQHLPFADETFDAVIMNGVLEYTPYSAAGSPRDVHRRVLREVRRVLKPGGMILVAIENRFSYRWLTGHRDWQAGGLRWVPFLPRVLANLYSRVVLRKPFRAWLHSYAQLRRLFSDAGLDDITVRGYFPNHVSYTNIFDIGDNDNARRMVNEIRQTKSLPIKERIVYGLAASAIPFRTLVHDFMITGRRPGGSQPSVPGTLTKAASAGLDTENSISYDLRSSWRCALLEVRQNGQSRRLLKYPRDDQWADLIVKEAECLERLSHLEISGEQFDVPDYIGRGNALGRPYLLMGYLPGLVSVLHFQDIARCRDVTNWLISLARASAIGTLDQSAIDERIAAARSCVPDLSHWQPIPTLSCEIKWEKIPTILVHGDFGPSNILVDGSQLNIIDWEFGDVAGPPLIDLIDFFLYVFYGQQRDYRLAWRHLFYDAAGADHRALMREYCQELSIPEAAVGTLVQLYLLHKLMLLNRLPERKPQVKRRELAELLMTTDFAALSLD